MCICSTVNSGVGYSTVEADGYALDQDQMGIDFVRLFLSSHLAQYL